VEIAGRCQNTLDPCQIPFDIDGDHTAKIEHLLPGQIMLGMTGQSRIDDLPGSAPM
jgi:hypothetical protein